jgi:hypothetical protein
LGRRYLELDLVAFLELVADVATPGMTSLNAPKAAARGCAERPIVNPLMVLDSVG